MTNITENNSIRLQVCLEMGSSNNYGHVATKN